LRLYEKVATMRFVLHPDIIRTCMLFFGRASLLSCLLSVLSATSVYSQFRIAGTAMIKIDGYNTKPTAQSIETGVRLNLIPDISLAIDWKLDKKEDFSFVGLGFWLRSTSVRSRLVNDGALLGQYFAPNIGLPDDIETHSTTTEFSIAPYIGVGKFYGGVVIGFPLSSVRTIQQFNRQQVSPSIQATTIAKQTRATTGAETNIEPFVGIRLPLHTSNNTELSLSIQAGVQLVSSQLIDISDTKDFLNSPIQTNGRSANIGVGISYFFNM
jgi:hypothetical protein